MRGAFDRFVRHGVLLGAASLAGCSSDSIGEPPEPSSVADAAQEAATRQEAGAAEGSDGAADADAAAMQDHLSEDGTAHGDSSTAESGSPHDGGHADVWPWDGGSADGRPGEPPGDAPSPSCEQDASDAPVQLACTGLYSDWPSRTIAPNVRAYAPAFPLWSDGAEKARYIALPPGTQIDTSNMDQWQFPVGTKLWKQFSLNGQLVETRYLWKRGVGDWARTTYAWSLDGTTATELTTGLRGWNGTSYEIPPQTACQACHAGRTDDVLGFEAVSLAGSGATGLTLDELVREGLLTQPPAAPIVVPGNATESAALAWLHANCGTTCHNRTSWDCNTTLFMRLDVATLSSVQSTDAWTTAVGQPLANYVPPSPMLRITPGDPSRSAVSYRASVRDSDPSQSNQMPPMDTHVVPDAGVAVINAWIASMPPMP
jgi:hypothetical protein